MNKEIKLKAFIQELLADYGEEKEIGDNDLLVTSGLLDSQAVLRMVVFLEDEFGVDLSEQEFDQNDFDSLTNLMRLINS